MFSFRKKREAKEVDVHVYAPVSGECISLDEVKDEVFSSRMMGDGVAFQFSGDTVYAPCDATIVMIANTLHAIGLQGDNGLEILLHVGMDTVNLNGKGFEVLVKQGAHVCKGNPLLKIDREFMKDQQIEITTPLIITNGSDFNLTFSYQGKSVIQGESAVVSME